ncbi:MAG: hypothetical protein Fur0040_02600 [Sideroxydans sp.]
MKTRLALFVAMLLLLPPLGAWLSDPAAPFNPSLPSITPDAASWITLPLLAALLAGANTWLTRRQGHNLLRLQTRYYLTLTLFGAVLGGLLLWLNRFAVSWDTPGARDALTLLGDSLLFALLLPTVLIVRALLASFPLLLHRSARGPALPAPPQQLASSLLLLAALGGLLAGPTWPQALFWLLWLSPLLLLMALQQLWHEDTIFAGLAQGDWSRPLLAALAGLVVCNLALASFRLAGGNLIWQLPHDAFAQWLYASYGLLCLQLGDVVAAAWRGKTRADLFRQKTFPIPVVSRK